MHDVLQRLHHTKMILSCLVLIIIGVILLAVGSNVDDAGAPRLVALMPWSELGGIMVGGGLLSVWLDRFLRREQEVIDELRLRRLFQEQAPAMRDAVLQAFAANHEDLERVATPEMLDQVITNSLALRLHDSQFADEIYQDIRDQAVGASERWHDASLSIKLSPLSMDSTSERGAPIPNTGYFSVTVRWEYRTIPRHSQRRFVCLSDREEYGELAHERGATSAWYMKPTSGIDASARETFELLRFAVNGEECRIRRSVRKGGQTYTASLHPDHLAAGEPTTVTYTYRTVTTQQGHVLFFDIEQPTRDLRIDFDYNGCDIASVSTLDLIPSVRPTRIELPPTSLSTGIVRVDLDGWIFPRSGVAFVWTLNT